MIKKLMAVLSLLTGLVAPGMGQNLEEPLTVQTAVIKFKGVRFCNCIHEVPENFSYWWIPCSGTGCVLLNGTNFTLHNHLPMPFTHGYADGDFDTVNVINISDTPLSCSISDFTNNDLPIYIEAGYNSGQYANEPEGYYIMATTLNPIFWAFGLTYEQMHGEILNQSVCGSNYLYNDFNLTYAGAMGGSCKIIGTIPIIEDFLYH